MKAKRLRAMVLAAGLMLVLGVGVALHWKILISRGGQLQALRAELARVRADNDAAQRACQDLRRVQEAVGRLGRQAPAEMDLRDLLRPLDADLQAEPSPEREITMRPAVAGPYLSRVPVTLRFKATFPRLFAVLQCMERSERLVRIDRVVAEKPGTETAGALQVQIDFSTFASTSEELKKWATAE